MLFLLLALLGLATVAYYIWNNYEEKSRPNYPRAPRLPLPFVGHLHLLTSKPHLTFLQWSKRHGKVFSVQLGQYNVVVINGHKAIQYVLSDSRFSGRPNFPLLNTLTNGQKGLQNNGTESWSHNRRSALTNLKGLGMGRRSLDTGIHAEITNLQHILSNRTGPVSIKSFLLEAVGNSVWELVAGQRMEDGFLWKTLEDLTECINRIGMAGYFPTATQPFSRSWRALKNLADQLNLFLSNQILEHEDVFDEENPRDFIDLCLKDGTVRKEHLTAVLNDFLIGGCVPTAWTLAWAVLYLSVHVEVQEELQQEIDSVLGSTLPTMEARPRMPFAIAVLMETLRKSSFFPLGIFHATTEDVNLLGFDVPKDTVICTNLHSAHHDPGVWVDPERFRPCRFIQKEGESVKLLRHEASIPFSTGKRSCVGELMAKELLFLYLTSLFQKFSFRVYDFKNVRLDPKDGFFSLPPDFKVIIKER